MRVAGQTLFLKEDGQTWGLFLEATPCVEHERGIGGLYRYLEIPELQVNGLEDRTVRKPGYLAPRAAFGRFVIDERLRGNVGDENTEIKAVATEVASLCFVGFDAPSSLLSYFGIRDDPSVDMIGAWSDFQAWVGFYGKEACAFGEELYHAIQIGDLALWIGYKDERSYRHGLILAIASRVPSSVRAQLLTDDIEDEELRLAALETGIEERLRDAAKRLSKSNPEAAQAFASCKLVPLWAVDLSLQNGRSLKTKYRVVFYLDSATASVSGWFTAEDLDDWILGKGAVLVEQIANKFRNNPDTDR